MYHIAFPLELSLAEAILLCMSFKKIYLCFFYFFSYHKLNSFSALLVLISLIIKISISSIVISINILH